ncbi:MAG: 50S ribosomal protein L35 [Candidatus Anoxychlamydiales bacterium]|nr:50S ribosomal protein L35 [Candidatus Anoxychlamydiales bacterium]
MSKVKAKTKKALAKRFKLTKNGKIKRTKQNKRHILTKKSSNRKRRLSKKALVSEAHRKTYIKLLSS